MASHTILMACVRLWRRRYLLSARLNLCLARWNWTASVMIGIK
jgi:hypothetical protein